MKASVPWLLDNPVTSFASFFDHSGSVADLEMWIHANAPRSVATLESNGTWVR